MEQKTISDRKVAIIIAAACADAAAQPLHWVYKPDALQAAIQGKGEEIEFLEPAANPFYRIPTGNNTCYGDQAYVVLESLATCGGFNKKDLVDRAYKHFGPGSEYDHSARVDTYKSKDLEEKFRWSNQPVSGPWKNGSIKDFLKNVEAGKEDPGSEDDTQVGVMYYFSYCLGSSPHHISTASEALEPFSLTHH